MKESEFENLYWKQYLMIEKEFRSIVKYVAIDSLNFKSYSDAYVKLLLEIGSEIDVVAKKMCKEINSNSNAHKIGQYASEITGRFPEFTQVIISCGDFDLKSWDGWNAGTISSPGSPIWWQIYNGIKHNRNKVETYGMGTNAITQMNYKLANQENVLNALAGLYQLELYLYLLSDHNQDVETPLPGSRLFKLKNQGWENKHFGKDTLSFIRKECLYLFEANTPYSDI